jgi:magnesium chelatase subunit D
VVLTDGRGNVPLAASRARRIDGPIGAEGVDDARRVAAALRSIHEVHPHLISPRPPLLRALPIALADALGADLVELAGDLP